MHRIQFQDPQLLFTMRDAGVLLLALQLLSFSPLPTGLDANTIKPVAANKLHEAYNCRFLHQNVVGGETRARGNSVWYVRKWRTSIHLITKIKRSGAPTTLYVNSTATFRPTIQLIHDVEPNPGPKNSSCGSSGRTTEAIKKQCTNNIKIAHLNVRSLKCREHYILAKETITANKIDIFTVSETWLNPSIRDVEIEIPGYKIFRLDRRNKTGGGICACPTQLQN